MFDTVKISATFLTTCSIERLFNTLKPGIKLGSISDGQLSGFCTINVIRKRLEENTKIIENTINVFGKNLGIYG